jgi:O-antigen/teichoic acid export membrane protein
VLRQSTVYLVGRGAAGAVQLVTVLLLARVLPLSAFGTYALVVATAGLANALLLWWLRLGMLRHLAAGQDDEVLSSVAGIGLLVTAGAAAVFGAAGVVLLTMGRPAAAGLMLAVMGLFVADGFYETCLERLRAEQRPARYGVACLVRSMLGLALAVPLGAATEAAYAPVAAFVLASALASLSSGLRWPRPRLARPMTRRLARYGLPLIMTFSLAYLLNVIDRFMLARLKSIEEAGRYAVAYDLPQQSLTLVLAALSLAAYPALIAADRTDARGSGSVLAVNLRMLLVVGVPATVLLGLAADDDVVVALDERYGDVVSVIRLVALATLLQCLKSYWADLPLLLRGRTRLQSGLAAAALAANVVLNAILIPPYGADGAAAATLATAAAALGGSWWAARSLVELTVPWRLLARLLVASAAAAAVAQALAGVPGPVTGLVEVVLSTVVLGASLLILDPALRRGARGLLGQRAG